MSIAIRITTADLEAQADRLQRMDAAALQEAATRAVNETVTKFEPAARHLMNLGINLTDAYVSSRMATVLAPLSANPVATITARGDLTILGHYSPVILSAPAPSGKRAKGDPKRGIPPGYKASGVSVEVTRGERKDIPGAFTMTLRRGLDAGEQVGVFLREGGNLKHLYGVAPYSLFRATIDAQQQIIGDQLVDEMLDELDEVIE